MRVLVIIFLLPCFDFGFSIGLSSSYTQMTKAVIVRHIVGPFEMLFCWLDNGILILNFPQSKLKAPIMNINIFWNITQTLRECLGLLSYRPLKSEHSQSSLHKSVDTIINRYSISFWQGTIFNRLSFLRLYHRSQLTLTTKFSLVFEKTFSHPISSFMSDIFMTQFNFFMQLLENIFKKIAKSIICKYHGNF